MKIKTAYIDGLTIVNVTPNELLFIKDDGVTAEVPVSGIVINAHLALSEVGNKAGVKLIKTLFLRDDESERILQEIEINHPDALVVGSITAARAFPGRILGAMSAPGFEFTPYPDKRLSLKCFATY